MEERKIKKISNLLEGHELELFGIMKDRNIILM